MKANSAGLIAALVVGIVVGVAGVRLLYAPEGNDAAAAATKPGAAPATSAQTGPVAPPAGTQVEVASVASVALPRTVSAVGSLRSKDAVMLRPEITGRIAEINFDEGGKIKKDQVVVRLDDSVAKAQLQQAQANLSLASSQHRRAAELSKQGFISKQARDEAASQLQVQQAAVALARAQLEKTAILAPFDGMIGLRNVSVGAYVSPGSDLVPIESIDPLQVDFRIPEHYLGQVHVGLKLALRFDALPGQTREGEVGAISPLVDVGGRSILLRANVPNKDGDLRPGMFSRVQLQFSDDHTLVVPETAVVPSTEGQFVYRVEDGRAMRVPVDVGQRRGGQVEITRGLAEGEHVVVAGSQKITDGAAVRIASPSAPAAKP